MPSENVTQQPGVTVLESRLIAFLDILGFSARLETSSLTDLHAEYSALIDDVQTTVFSPTEVHCDYTQTTATNFAKAQFLFDSVVLVSHPLDGEIGPRSVFHLIAAVSLLLEKAFARRLPLRGAIGFGDFLDDSDREIFLSAVFPSLVRAEHDQDWCGAVILPAAVDTVFKGLLGAVPADVPEDPANFLLKYQVPTKNSAGVQSHTEYWCVNWVWFSDNPNLADALSWLTESKRENVRAFINHVNQMPSRRLHVEPLPQSVLPAVAVRIQLARSGFRVKVLDADGRAVDLPAGTTLNFQMLVEQSATAG
jgi:hypothetical protein